MLFKQSNYCSVIAIKKVSLKNIAYSNNKKEKSREINWQILNFEK